MGRSARDLDATHRRDGIGLLLFTLTIVVAAVTWFSVDGWLTGVVTAVVTGAVGALDVVVPLFLLWATLRVLRHPDQGSTTGRLAIGTGILLASACGIWSLAKGAPSPSDGSEAMRAAGGWVGWLVTAPIVSAVGIWLAYLWLVVLLGFGLLVVTATPIHAVPERLGALRDALLLRREPAALDGRGRAARRGHGRGRPGQARGAGSRTPDAARPPPSPTAPARGAPAPTRADDARPPGPSPPGPRRSRPGRWA